MSFFGFGSKEADEADSDPNKIISGWTGALIAPKWAEKDSYKVRVTRCLHGVVMKRTEND